MVHESGTDQQPDEVLVVKMLLVSVSCLTPAWTCELWPP